MIESASSTHRDRLWRGIRLWLQALNNYPGWQEWIHTKVARTLYEGPSNNIPERWAKMQEFVFSPDLEKQHAVVYQYLGLQQTVDSLKECEYYFRRYPFARLPVSRASHLTNVCEMYFGRFYEFKERLKKFFEAVKALEPTHNLDIGRFIKDYERVFDDELRQRNVVNHHGRFNDLAIDRVFLADSTKSARGQAETSDGLSQYREFTREWVQRVRRKARRMEEVLEAVAQALLRTCRFLALHALMGTVAQFKRIDLSRIQKNKIRTGGAQAARRR